MSHLRRSIDALDRASRRVARNPERVTRFMQDGSGARRLGLSVRGIRVVVEPRGGDEQDAADALAEQIAALGPEDGERRAPAPPPAPMPPALVAPRPAKAPFVVGERIYCTVHGAEGFCTVTEVGTGRNRGRIKITSERGWCPEFNFDHERPTR